MGLLSGLQNMMGRANAGSLEKPSFVNRLNTFGAQLQDISDGGNRAGDLEQQRQAMLQQQQAAQQRQQLAAMADQLGLSPKEKFLLMANPQVYGQLLKEQLAPKTISEGQTVLGADNMPAYTAPKTMTFGDNIYSVGPNGVADLFKRPQTYQEMQTQTRDTLNNQREIERLGISRGQLGVSQGQLGLEREKHLARMRAGGYGTPGVGGVIGTSLDPNEWEIQ